MLEILSYSFLDEDGSVIAEQNSGILLMPASNMKIITSFAAYYILGKSYIFRSYFSLENGILSISGGPFFKVNIDDFKWVNKLNSEIQKLNFDHSYIDLEKYNQEWTLDDIKHCYATPISQFSLNEGCYMVKQNSISPLPVHSDSPVSITNPLNHTAKIIAFLSGKKNIGYTIGPKSDLNYVANKEEKLTEILSHTLEESCNFSAELILKYLGYIKYSSGTWENGIRAIYSVIDELGMDLDEIIISDGSGLSRKNMVTSNFISHFIFNIYKKGFEEFFSYMPGPGTGTLFNRLSELSGIGIRAKTGTLFGVSALSGYSRKKRIFFSIIINNSRKNTELRQNEIDNLLGTIMRIK